MVQARLDGYSLRPTVVALEKQVVALEKQVVALETQAEARIGQISAISTRAAELERVLDHERRTRWARLGQRVRASGLHRSIAVRGAIALADGLRRRLRRLPSPAGGHSWSLVPVALEANEQAYSVRQPQSPSSDRPTVLHAIANFCLGGSSRLVVDLIESLGEDFKQPVVTRYIPRPPAY